MTRSMTGYGKAECLLPRKKITIELRSLNSKQLDINTRIPALYKEKELDIRQLIGKKLLRGKVECSIFMELTEETTPGSINANVVKAYYEQLYRISGELGLEATPELLSSVMRLPDTLKAEKAELEEEEWNTLQAGMVEALEKLNEFRLQEGKAMESDLKERVSCISSKLKEVDALENERMERIRERIGNNLLQYLKKEDLDENRFEQELIYYIEKLDVSEEKVRLANHCTYFIDTLAAEEAAGKKLGFISQEMGREINTLGSKANHAEIQRLVVEMKDELERIKEQVLNIL